MNHLFELERTFWTGGADLYRARLTSDFVMIVPGLGMLDREATIEGLAGAARWVEVEMEDRRVIELSEDSAIVAYHARARREGQESPYSAWISSSYARRDGEWKLAAHHQSPTA